MFTKLRALCSVALMMLAILLMSLPVSASLVTCNGTPDSSGNCPMEIDSDGQIEFNDGVDARYELLTTNDTLTASDSGKTFIVTVTTGSPITITLPSATSDSLGMEFTFVAAPISGLGTAATSYFELDPSALDFIYSANAAGTLSTTVAAGDRVRSAGLTGDSIHIINPKALYWYTEDVRGTFSDAN